MPSELIFSRTLFLLACSLSISTVFCSCMSASRLVERTWSILATCAPNSLLFWTSLSYLLRRELSSWKQNGKWNRINKELFWIMWFWKHLTNRGGETTFKLGCECFQNDVIFRYAISFFRNCYKVIFCGLSNVRKNSPIIWVIGTRPILQFRSIWSEKKPLGRVLLKDLLPEVTKTDLTVSYSWQQAEFAKKKKSI